MVIHKTIPIMTPFEELGLFATVSDLKFVKMLIDMNTQAMLHLIERWEMSQKKYLIVDVQIKVWEYLRRRISTGLENLNKMPNRLIG